MSERNGLIITGHESGATCVACGKPKECLYLEGTDGEFQGWVCFTHLKAVLRLRLANRPRTEPATTLFDGARDNRQATQA